MDRYYVALHLSQPQLNAPKIEYTNGTGFFALLRLAAGEVDVFEQANIFSVALSQLSSISRSIWEQFFTRHWEMGEGWVPGFSCDPFSYCWPMLIQEPFTI